MTDSLAVDPKETLILKSINDSMVNESYFRIRCYIGDINRPQSPVITEAWALMGLGDARAVMTAIYDTICDAILLKE